MKKFIQAEPNSNLRCSSEGEDAAKYHDPSTHFTESGKQINRYLTGRYGLRGVIIPRANILGGSMGFDPHKPRLVHIDPHLKGESCIVDLSKVNQTSMNKAMKEAAKNPATQNDLSLFAAQVYQNLAIDEQEDTTMKEELISSAVTPRIKKAHITNAHIANAVEDFEDPFETPIQQGYQKQAKSKFKKAELAPSVQVTFATEGWGVFEASYHAVIRNDCLLVLCWAEEHKGAIKFFPPCTDKKLKVTVEGDELYVHSLGNKFKHNGYEYCILVIDGEDDED